MPPDVVYPIRRQGKNQELRYSLRSLANLPHGRVWIVGHKPGGLQNVEHIPTIQNGTKYLNATRNLVVAAQSDEISDPFILMNDDFYIMRRMRKLPALHRGTMRDVIREHRRYRQGPYVRGMLQTYRLLRRLKIRDPLSYELHLPMLIHKDPLIEAWERGQDLAVLHIRTAYGNLADLGGTQVADCKVYTAAESGWRDWPFLSSNDNMQTPLGRFLRKRFGTRSEYEQ